MRHSNRQSGFVLLVTVIIIAAITSIILSYSQTVFLFGNRIKQQFNAANARNIADSSLNYALEYINSNDYICAGTTLNIELDNLPCTISISPENGKININNIVNASDEYDKEYTELMLRLIDVYNKEIKANKYEYSLIPAIIDAIDKNKKTCEIPFIQRNNKGAENKYYTSKSLPDIANKKMSDITNLSFVKGFDDDILYNTHNGKTAPFIKCLYAGSHEKIDVNSAPAEVISAIVPEISLTKARQLVSTGKNPRYQTLSDFYEAAEIYSDTASLDSILQTQTDDMSYSIDIKVESEYKVIILTALAKKDDNDKYNVKKVYCN